MRARVSSAVLCFVLSSSLPAAGAVISVATQECIDCHQIATPGIVDDWQRSLHAGTHPGEALAKDPLDRRISAETVPDEFKNSIVGCAECHTMRQDRHGDTFEHNGFQVHVVVSPEDCAVCHPVERAQYEQNLMSHAYGNLHENAVYRSLSEDANRALLFEGDKLVQARPDDLTDADSCYFCHGTKVEKTGLKTRKTTLGGEMSFPVLTGWPNQGVGRLNPDNTIGACTSCHARHQFSIAMARKPHTCSQCHKGPDVPAYAAYMVSKHGNIYESLQKDWDFNAVPWMAGRDFTAPTCAACHASLIVDMGREVVAQRTHRMNDRADLRLMGLIYAAPHPKSPDTTIIRNNMGLPLPTELTGEPAADFLIDAAERGTRRERLMKVCYTCHSYEWAGQFFERLDHTVKTTNDLTRTATLIMLQAWDKGAARGLAQNDSLFNEALERKWVEQWLFYANSTRFASAMGGADYGAFANGRWYLSKNIQEMMDWLSFKLGTKN